MGLGMTEYIEHSAGGLKTYPLPPGMIGDAEFKSQANMHRLWLTRNWHPHHAECDYALFCGMNPSTAHRLVNDPTVLKDIGYAKRWGFESMVKVNVSPYRLTYSDRLENNIPMLHHPENLKTIRDKAAGAKIVVMVTGRVPHCLKEMAVEIFEQLQRDGRKMVCIGTTKRDNWPLHTSRTAYARPRVDFNWPTTLNP